jgi:sigma-B regulation protein RsbU (phosphoserine phosphatase)
LHPEERKLVYANGGHNPPFLLRADGELTELSPGGPLVGALPQAKFQAREIELRTGDTLLAYTDGITEAVSTSDEEFGEERLVQLTRTATELKAQEIADRVFDEVRGFTGLENQADDMTLLVLKVTS